MKQILIVDDNKLNLTAAKNALSDLYKITAVISGAQALKYLEKNIPDLILLDINMPEMDGFAVMAEIQGNEMLQRIPIVFLTADTDAETETRCLESGAQDFIAKPFVPEVMRSRISRILELEELRKSLADRLDQKIREVSDIKSKSFRDALTGLWNRAYTEEAVGALLQEGVCGYLFMMDMDNFKAINDLYGHIAGDHVLKLFAETLLRYAAEGDVVCRIGGDEFMTFVAGEKSRAEVSAHADHIITDMCRHLETCGYETNSSVSVGIANYPADGSDFKSLYNAADKALYYVKQNGKNTYHFFSDHHAAESSRAGTTLNLQYLHEIMCRTDGSTGAYAPDFDSFHHVYSCLRRLAEQGHSRVQTLLFTLNQSAADDSSEAEAAMDLLERAMHSVLRPADVYTRYSGRQAIVLLPDTDHAGGAQTANRILESFGTLYSGSLRLTYDLAPLQGKKTVNI